MMRGCQRDVIIFIIHITILLIKIGYCIILHSRVMINFKIILCMLGQFVSF